MLDSAELIAAAAALRAVNEPFVIATVVRVQGSSYRRPGARMILAERGRVAGSVSGGCLEGNLVRTGLWKTKDGPVVVTFDSTDPDDPEAVLGCGGVVDILLERGGPADPLALAQDLLARGVRGAIATVIAGAEIGAHWVVEAEHSATAIGASNSAAGPPPSLAATSSVGSVLRSSLVALCATASASGRPEIARVGDVEVLVEPVVPPIQLYVFGTGLDAVPLVESASRLGWDVHVWNGANRFETADRFPTARILGPDLDAVRAQIERTDRAVAIVMGHDQRRDRSAFAMLASSRAAYIGVLGPRHRTVDIAPPGALDDPRVHAPVGLDLGAETPAEIAISVIAEVLAAVRGTTAAHLRTRPTIHHSHVR